MHEEITNRCQNAVIILDTEALPPLRGVQKLKVMTDLFPVKVFRKWTS